MNNVRRKALAEIVSRIEEIRCDLESLQEEEAEYRDNMPENLQNSERYQIADDACSSLEDALYNLDDAVDNINSAIEG